MTEIVTAMIVGAVIGYLDHWVVVKLVFWPRREFRVLGRRVPLTPGVFAARRKEFAVAVAQLIEERFITGEDVYAAVRRAHGDGVLQKVSDKYPVLGMAMNLYFSTRTDEGFRNDCRDLADGVRGSRVVAESVRTSMDAMSIDEVEGMVMAVIASELRLVIWLGAPLGAVVGFLQALLDGN